MTAVAKRAANKRGDFYEKTAYCLELILEKRASLKTLVYNQDAIDKKLLLKCLDSTLRNYSFLQKIVKKSNLKKIKSENVTILLVHDLLFGKLVKSKHTVAVLQNKTRLRAELVKLGGKPEQIVSKKYLRLTHKCSMDEFTKLGLVPDEHIPDIYEFNLDLHDHKLYKDGMIVIQDKASCFPAHILAPLNGAVVMDCCAAPGNKTSHLSCIMKNTGKIYALDKSQPRLKTLKVLTDKVGCKNIIPIHQDFLSIVPKEYADVEYILLDPSCSGSGMPDQFHLQDTSDPVRLKSLADFQKAAILHAFTFPHVKKVVYSTCSVHVEENEDVVEFVLSQKDCAFRLAHDIIPTWPRRGLEKYKDHQHMIRALPQDGTIGFFVVMFERII